MAWTAPRTWSPGETVTASLMNAHVRDQLNALSSKALIIGIGEIAGAPLTTGLKRYVEIPVSLTITGWSIVADQAGAAVLDLWKDSWANFPPDVADTIAGTEKPTLAAAQAAQDLDLTTWDTEIDAGDVLALNIDSVDGTLTYLALSLRVEPR